MRHTAVLMATDFVAGTATGMDDQGAPVILVLSEQELPTKAFPLRIEGLKVQQMVVGKLVAMKGKPGGGGGGDSGSLMVEDLSTNPLAVGLLFAGSTSSAIANPIRDVLNFLNASMVGNQFQTLPTRTTRGSSKRPLPMERAFCYLRPISPLWKAVGHAAPSHPLPGLAVRDRRRVRSGRRPGAPSRGGLCHG